MKIEFKPGKNLSPQEIESINQAKAREWNIGPMSDEQRMKHLFVLLKESNETILAQGELIPIDKVVFDGETFSIIGIGGIIANQKGQGFGKKLMTGIINYLHSNQKPGIGFAGDNVIGFYKTCGFQSDVPSLKRFVHIDGRFRITNTTEDCVFYIDSKDGFMEKVLSKPALDVFLPRDPDW